MFCLEDRVLIPKELMEECRADGDYLHGIVRQVCAHHVVFLVEGKFMRSLNNSDCEKVIVVRPSKFHIYDNQMKMRDVADAMCPAEGTKYEKDD